MKAVDTGGLSFMDIRDCDKCYVDKSLLIKDILSYNDRGVFLYTRPRRFGKTTNLTMLDAFFNIQYAGNDWFEGLAISDYPEYERYKNAYPVINLDLRTTNTTKYEYYLTSMGSCILQALKEHAYLFNSPTLLDDERQFIDSVMSKTLTRDDIKYAISTMSGMLRRYHGKPVVLLIDEYDAAVSDHFGSDSHREIMDHLGEFMSSSLKSNKNLQMAYVTGIMQIAKESIFSGMNNVTVFNIFSDGSDERFGFTESEVRSLLEDYGHPEAFETVRQWYDGYRFGNVDVYNPFSVMCYIHNGMRPQPYWSNSGGNWIIRYMLSRVDGDNFQMISDIINGGSADVCLKASLPYSRLGADDSSLFSLMVMAGYLKAVPSEDGLYRISIPNHEVRGEVEGVISETVPIRSDLFHSFNLAVLDCDAGKVESIIQSILLGGSYMNLNSEDNYALVLMTMMHGLIGSYTVRTESEAGNGRLDIILTPKVGKLNPIIIELKRAGSEEELDAEVDDAIGQIHRKRYYLGMPGRIVLVGMAFFVKVPRVRMESIENGPEGTSYIPVVSS